MEVRLIVVLSDGMTLNNYVHKLVLELN